MASNESHPFPPLRPRQSAAPNGANPAPPVVAQKPATKPVIPKPVQVVQPPVVVPPVAEGAKKRTSPKNNSSEHVVHVRKKSQDPAIPESAGRRYRVPIVIGGVIVLIALILLIALAAGAFKKSEKRHSDGGADDSPNLPAGLWTWPTAIRVESPCIYLTVTNPQARPSASWSATIKLDGTTACGIGNVWGATARIDQDNLIVESDISSNVVGPLGSTNAGLCAKACTLPLTAASSGKITFKP